MLRRKLFLSGAVLYVVLTVSLVSSVEAPSTTWAQVYGGTNIDEAHSLVATFDGGYAVTGYTGTLIPDRADFWLVKIDASGNMEWNQTYGRIERSVERAYAVVESSDGGYAIAGYTLQDDESRDFWLVKTDEYGNMEWNQTYGGIERDEAYSLAVTTDGGYAIVGRTASFGAGDLDFWLIKTDEEGNTLWNRTYGGTGNDSAFSLVESSDSGYAIAGFTFSFGEGLGDFWLVKTDEYGMVAELCPPYICVDSPQNMTYNTGNVSLTFTVNEETTWMGYSLDGEDNVTLTETTVNLAALAEGSHTLTVYATDIEGDTGASETFTFTVAKEPDPTQLAWTTIALAAAIIAAASIGIIRWYLKTKHTQNGVK